MTRRAMGSVFVVAIAAAACSPGPRDAGGSASPALSRAPQPLCRRLSALDDRLRVVRSLSDTTASVQRYAQGATGLDVAFRRMRAVAAADLDLAPIEYANGRFGEIVRGMAPDLGGPTARAQVALILESYNAAVYSALVTACGPTSVGAAG